jgi:hypothetical protein
MLINIHQIQTLTKPFKSLILNGFSEDTNTK